MEISEIRERYGKEIEAFRTAAHRCPELGTEERETTALIRQRMGALGLEELALGLATGAAFRLRGTGAGKTVVLRADIDGLPVTEPAENPDCSAHPGRMHACGHDVHMAALYGAALEVFDYSPEIDTYLRILCFPTFRGHCGCILSDVSQSHYIRTSDDSPETLMRYLGKLLETN